MVEEELVLESKFPVAQDELLLRLETRAGGKSIVVGVILAGENLDNQVGACHQPWKDVRSAAVQEEHRNNNQEEHPILEVEHSGKEHPENLVEVILEVDPDNQVGAYSAPHHEYTQVGALSHKREVRKEGV